MHLCTTYNWKSLTFYTRTCAKQSVGGNFHTNKFTVIIIIIMKQLLIPFLLIIIIPNLKCQNSKSSSFVDYGFVDTSWTYRNEGLGITFKLQDGWHFMNFLSEPNTYVQVGAGLINIEGYTKPIKVPISEFKNVHNNSSATLFAFSQLGDSSEIVTRTLDLEADKTFYFGLTSTTGTSIYDFLRTTCLKCTDDTFKKIYLPNIIIGNTIFSGYLTNIKDKEGNKLGRFFGIKKIKEMYLVLQYNFPDTQSFESYKLFLKDLKIQ